MCIRDSLYTEWGITEKTDFSQMKSEDYPILSELYDYIEIEYLNFDEQKPQLYTKEMLQQVLLGLSSMCTVSYTHLMRIGKLQRFSRSQFPSRCRSS